MHFVKGFECALDIMERDNDWESKYVQLDEMPLLPKPIHEKASPLFRGVPAVNDEWIMNHLACRTNFLPSLGGSITDLVGSGMSPFADTAEKVMDDRSNNDYENGWLLDVGTLEKRTKRKVLNLGGLGYIDMKIALYGTTSSGKLEMFLPYETGEPTDLKSKKTLLDDAGTMEANRFISHIIVCEVNEKRGENECDVGTDMSFLVGGVIANVEKMSEVQYLKKEICIKMNVPKNAKLVSRNDRNGLEVEISVNNPSVNHDDGACNIAHVVWENQANPIAK